MSAAGKVQMNRGVDLSSLALHFAFRSVIYVVLATIAASAIVLTAEISGLDWVDHGSITPLATVLWVGLQIQVVLQIRRIARSNPVVQSHTHSLHNFEFAVAGFLILYSLARPYLVDSDASAYSGVKHLFEVFIGILVLWHCLVLAIFRARPNRRDVWGLAASIVASVVVAF